MEGVNLMSTSVHCFSFEVRHSKKRPNSLFHCLFVQCIIMYVPMSLLVSTHVLKGVKKLRFDWNESQQVPHSINISNHSNIYNINKINYTFTVKIKNVSHFTKYRRHSNRRGVYYFLARHFEGSSNRIFSHTRAIKTPLY